MPRPVGSSEWVGAHTLDYSLITVVGVSQTADFSISTTASVSVRGISRFCLGFSLCLIRSWFQVLPAALTQTRWNWLKRQSIGFMESGWSWSRCNQVTSHAGLKVIKCYYAVVETWNRPDRERLSLNILLMSFSVTDSINMVMSEGFVSSTMEKIECVNL